MRMFEFAEVKQCYKVINIYRLKYGEKRVQVCCKRLF